MSKNNSGVYITISRQGVTEAEREETAESMQELTGKEAFKKITKK